MTAHDKNLPDTPTPAPDTTPQSPDTPANYDKSTVIVWRITADPAGDPDTAAAADADDSPLTPRLARHLVAIYSDVHGTIIDFDADITLKHAAKTTGRNYVTITGPADHNTTTQIPGPAALILIRWPRPITSGPTPDAYGLLSRCQQHLADDGSTIVIVTISSPGADGTSYRDYEQVLLHAAETAGLRHLHDIVPVNATDGRDAFTYATAQRATEPGADSGSPSVRQPTATTLVIFGHPGRRP